WNLISLLISFQLLPYPHTGANIANCIKTVTDDYLITTKLQTITLDNASSNDVAIRELINSASQDLINIKKELFHNRCLAHILNLIVKDGLKEISEAIIKIRSCIKAIHTTPRWRQMFLDVCEYESVKATIPPLD
ncbi:4087_t:CDS:2, partial [Racocetra persica]